MSLERFVWGLHRGVDRRGHRQHLGGGGAATAAAPGDPTTEGAPQRRFLGEAAKAKRKATSGLGGVTGVFFFVLGMRNFDVFTFLGRERRVSIEGLFWG